MRQRPFTCFDKGMSVGIQGTLTCRELSLRELRRLPRIESGFTTDVVLRLDKLERDPTLTWRLVPERLTQPFHKLYDQGNPDDWLESYRDEAELKKLRFLAAGPRDHPTGLLTWQELRWNETIWLVDIRTRPEARRQGVGSLLVDELKRRTQKSGMRGIRLETQTNNFPAVSFYRKHGFQITGFDDHLYTNRDLKDGDVALFLFWECGGSH